ncbi:MAG: hypothetical protein ACI9WU_000334 [Myxococcota bacterium]
MIWTIAAAVILAAYAWTRKGPSPASLALRAAKGGDTTPVVAALSELPEAKRPTAFDQAVRSLWDAYHRPLAARLVCDGAPWVSAAPITQYWIKHIMEVEPEIAKEAFTEEFLEAIYDPDRAARCGRFG